MFLAVLFGSWSHVDPGGSKGALHRIVSPGRLLQQAVQRWQSHWALSKFSKFWPSPFSNCNWSSSSSSSSSQSSSSSPTKIDHDRSTYLIILHYVQKAMTFAFLFFLGWPVGHSIEAMKKAAHPEGFHHCERLVSCIQKDSESAAVSPWHH